MTAPGQYTTQTDDMVAVHGALQSAFDAVDGLVDGAGTDASRVDTVASFYANTLEFLHVHHDGEDELVYPILKERCPDQLAMLERIDSQHTLINEPTAAAQVALAAWQSAPGATTAGDLTMRLAAVNVAMGPHFTDEEADILPLASAYLSEEEWGVLPGHALRSFTTDKPWLALGMIRERRDDEQNVAMLEGMPPPVRQLWIDQWEPAYVQFIASVRAIAPVGPVTA